MDKPVWMPHWLWKARDEIVGAALLGILVASIEPILAWYQQRPPNPFGALALFAVAGLITYLCVRAFKHGLTVSSQWRTAPFEGPSTIKIHFARYGNKTKYKDVKGKVESLINGNRLVVLAANEVFGDPAPREDKELIVDYSLEGGPIKRSVRPQSALLLIPEDPWLLDEIERLQSEIEARGKRHLDYRGKVLAFRLDFLEIEQLRNRANYIRNRWPNCLFVESPLNRVHWSPFIGKPETGMSGEALDAAIVWHSTFSEYAKRHSDRKYAYQDFDGVMSLLGSELSASYDMLVKEA